MILPIGACEGLYNNPLPCLIKDVEGKFTVQVRGVANDIHPTAKFGKNCILSGWTRVGANVVVGEGTRLGNYVCIDNGSKVGSNTNFQNGVHLTNDTVVGDRVFIGAYVVFADEKYPAVGEQIRSHCYVGNDVVIGTRAIIVACDIADRAVLGALSMLTKNLPAGSIWAGIPAKPVGIRTEYDLKKKNWEDRVLKSRTDGGFVPY